MSAQRLFRASGLALLTALLAAAPARGGIIAYQVPAATPGTQAFSGPLGMDFNVPTAPIAITHLGVFDDSSNGLNRALTAYVYDRTATAAPLVSLTFSTGTGDPLVGGSRFQALPQKLVLPSGFQGTVVGENYGTGERNGNSPTAPAWTTRGGSGLVSFVGSGRYGFTAGAYPPSPDGGPANRYAAGTFRFELADPGRPINVFNHSFELPAHGPGGWSNSVPGWTTGNAGNYYPPAGTFTDPVPDGNQIGFVNSGGLLSNSSLGGLKADTLYILQVDVGKRSVYTVDPAFSIALRAGGTTLGWANNGNIFNIETPPAGQFRTATLYATANHNATIGSPLSINLTGGGGAQAAFDNVRLSKLVGMAFPVANHSFESPDVAPNGGWAEAQPTWDWVPSGAGGGVYEHAGEIVPADGSQSAFIRARGSLTQTFDFPFLPDHRYILLAEVGDRRAAIYSGYSIELLAGGHTVAIDSNPLGGGDDIAIEGGFYLTAYLDYLVPSEHALAGLPLGIRLSALDGGTQTYFDNIRLFVIVPEPATCALLLLGLGTLAARRRRKAAGQ